MAACRVVGVPDIADASEGIARWVVGVSGVAGVSEGIARCVVGVFGVAGVSEGIARCVVGVRDVADASEGIARCMTGAFEGKSRVGAGGEDLGGSGSCAFTSVTEPKDPHKKKATQTAQPPSPRRAAECKDSLWKAKRVVPSV